MFLKHVFRCCSRLHFEDKIPKKHVQQTHNHEFRFIFAPTKKDKKLEVLQIPTTQKKWSGLQGGPQKPVINGVSSSYNPLQVGWNFTTLVNTQFI